MWTEIRVTSNIILAEAWKELFEAEGVPVRILPEQMGVGVEGKYRVLIPEIKKHVVDEIMRKV